MDIAPVFRGLTHEKVSFSTSWHKWQATSNTWKRYLPVGPWAMRQPEKLRQVDGLGTRPMKPKYCYYFLCCFFYAMVKRHTSKMKPCVVGADGKCVSNYTWCQYNCGRCRQHCPKNKCPNKKKLPLQDKTSRSNEPRDCSGCKRKYCVCGSGLCYLHCSCQKSNEQEPTLAKVTIEKHSNYLAANTAISKYAKADLVPITSAKSCGFQVLDESDVHWLDNYPELDNDPKLNTELNTRVSESQPVEFVVVETFDQLLQSFGADDKSYMKNFPSGKMRCDPNAASQIESTKNSRNSIPAMVNILLKVVEVAASLILPGDPAFLLQHLSKKLLKKHGSSAGDTRSEGVEKAMRNTFQLCQNMPKHTMGYRVLRAVLVEPF